MAGIDDVFPKEYGYIILVIVLYYIVNMYMSIQVGRARNLYNVQYPALYATEADTPDYKLFNCIQRGHQNSLESLPLFLVLLVVGGLKHPIICAAIGLTYTIIRFFYFTGYSSGDPKGRLPIGGFNSVAILGLVGINIWSASGKTMTGIVELLPKEYGYIILTIIAYGFVNIYMQLQVGKARKKYKVWYPKLYATEADTKDFKVFNCIQRGHQNSLESLPIFFVLMVLGGLKHPLTCSALGLVYTVSRFFYFTGYSSGNPKGRLPIGRFNSVALVGLAIVNIWFGLSLLMA